ncbi:MAG TPA: efflux RND transporter permease subunit, partial [Candidatus Avipropionibacterium avicola]|nr:efflux RND transporter permease subunit [Candidatus Avipropionibacterium avicola]
DYSLNILTLGALTIAIGRVVDDSIVVIENIKRHLSYGTPKLKAITTAVREVAMAITAATITTVAVFLPIGVVGGQVGELFRPFAVTVALALLASLLVSLTIVPVLAYWFLKAPEDVVDPDAVQTEAEDKERRSWLQRAYVPSLTAVVRHPVIALLVAAVLLGGTLALVPNLKQDFLGDAGQDTITVTQEFEPGENLDSQTEQAIVVEDALREVPGVDVVQVTVGGGGFMGFGGGGSDQATFSITTGADADPAVVTEDIRTVLEGLEDVGELSVSAASQYSSNDVVVDITATDPDVLDEATTLIHERMGTIEGVTDVRSSLVAAQPRIEVLIDEEKAAEKGLTAATVTQTLQGLITPATVGSIERGGTTIDIDLKIDDAPAGVDKLKKVEIAGPAGPVKLSDIASVKVIDIAPTINHTDGQRSASVTLTPTADDLGQVNAAVQQALSEVDLPEGAVATVGGVSADQAEAFEQLGLALLVAIAIVYVVMVATFKSLVQPLILLISIPFAATGVLAALLLSDTALGVPALIGLLMLIGIVVTNAIVLIDLVNHYRSQGQSIDDALVNGARQRLRPILMTAAATIMALTPMALGVTGGGVFISRPLAIVVIGGLFSSTLLTLFLVPVLYRLVERSAEKRSQRSHARRMARLERKGLTLDAEGRVIHVAAAEQAAAAEAGSEADAVPDEAEPAVVPQGAEHAAVRQDGSAEQGSEQAEPEDEESYRPRRAR